MKPGISSIQIDRSASKARRSGWDHGEFMIPISASFEGGELIVSFANGDVVRLDPARLCPGADWSRARVVDSAYLEAPTPGGLFEIDGSHLRALTNPDYGAYQEWAYRYTARSLGRQLRCLREQRGVSGHELARRIGMRPQHLLRLEKGEQEPGIKTVAHILGALGATWAELTITNSASST